jgi:hypothetical protein
MRTLSHYIIYFKMQVTVRDLWFDVTLQSDARKGPQETSVSAQLYVMTIVYAVTGKDNRPQNQRR